MKREIIEEKLKSLPGSISFYYRNLVTGKEMSYRENEDMMAASVIKIYIMADVYYRIERGELDPDKVYCLRDSDRVPPSGVITFLHEGLELTLKDLVTLMIIVSDNTATNMLIDILGMDRINREIHEMGYTDMMLRRKMIDTEKISRGIYNSVTAKGTGIFLADLEAGRVVSPSASASMISVLKNQQFNDMIPLYLGYEDPCPEVAHKTGGDIGIANDVGIVYAREPFVVSFCGNNTDTCAFQRIIGEISLDLCREADEVREDSI